MNASLKSNIAVLSISQALFFMANTIAITTIPLVGLQYAPSPIWATVPLGVQFAGTMASTYSASAIMGALGRRAGLLIGSLFAIASGLISFQAVMAGSFFWFCVGTALYGVYSAFAQYYRFAAADAADQAAGKDTAANLVNASRAKAISWVLAGGVVAAVAGPEIAKATRDLFAPILFAGCYLAIAGLGAVSLITLTQLRLSDGRKKQSAGKGRPLGVIFRQSTTATAVLGAITAYVTMNLLMTATPLAMAACGLDFDDTAFVIQGHVLGMFAPSFFTGKLIARFGTYKIALAGSLLLLASALVNLTGIELFQFFSGLLLLGLGWNFLFISSTTLLTASHRPEEKSRVQGMNDLLLFGCVVLSASSAGLIHELLGWQVMNVAALIFVGGFIAALVAKKPAVERELAA